MEYDVNVTWFEIGSRSYIVTFKIRYVQYENIIYEYDQLN